MKSQICNLCLACMTLVSLLTLSSCEKPILSDESEDEGKTYNLVVNVFQIEQTPFPLTRAAVEEACSRLNFIIYSPDGTRVAYVNQVEGDPGFGTASFQLDQGDYQVVVVGHSSNGNPTTTDPAKIRFSNAQGYTDTFYSSSNVTIGEEQITKEVSLDRITALCRVVFTDDYPENVTQMRFRYTGGSGAFNAATGFGSVKSTQTIFFDVDTGQKEFDLYTILHDTDGTIHLLATAYDSDDNVVLERTFDIPLTRNKITWYTGEFFSGTSHSGFTVTVNTDWAGEVHLTF